MAYELGHRLVVGVASSALFDLTESDSVFREQGEAGYREYQGANLGVPLAPGVAFPFIRRLLSLNDLSDLGDPLVEVIVLSRNDPDTGLRVMRSIEHRELSISRAVFMRGKAPYKFMPALGMSLFLSADRDSVLQAVRLGLPAGQVLTSDAEDDLDDPDLRIAFDFDGVLGDDESEQVFQKDGLARFHEHERAQVDVPQNPGPLRDFLAKVNLIQTKEEARALVDPGYRIRLHVSLVTARNAPAHERAIRSLKSWGVNVNDAFFLGGIAKAPILEALRPHMFFDDQLLHLETTAPATPSVHIPFGRLNECSTAPPSGAADDLVGPE